MAISLYSSRLIINALGIIDYGLYNLVAGVIIMFGFLNSAMTASTQRFLTYELGTGNKRQLKLIFDNSLTIHYIIAGIVLILAESFGLYFLNCILNIPSSRIYAANFLFQFSIISLLLNIISVPYTSAIVANEKVGLYSIVTIAETILRLLSAIALAWLEKVDKLITFGVFLLLIALFIRVMERLICTRNFRECRNSSLSFNKIIIKDLGKFAAWNLMGVAAGIGYMQGINILLNIFFGAAINATRGIAMQVQNAVNMLITSFQMAAGPVITKDYSINKIEKSIELTMLVSKYSYFLILLICVPLIMKTKFVLSFWLGILPEYVEIFVKLTLIELLINSLSGPLQILAQATGKIRTYQILVSGLLMLNLPIAYLLLKNGASPESTMIVSIVISILALVVRLIVLGNLTNLSFSKFFSSVLSRITIVSLIVFLVFYKLEPKFSDDFLSLFYLTLISTLLIGMTVLLFGASSKERSILVSKIKEVTS